MFKKLRIRIIAAIMSVLIIVFAATLSLIYVFSYKDVMKSNLHMLKEYADDLGKDNGKDNGKEPGKPGKNRDQLYKLTTFYHVAFDASGTVTEISNAENSELEDSELTELAKKAADSGEKSGTASKLLYFVKDTENGGKLVALMSGTAIQGSFYTLFRYALIFGSCLIAVLFVFSWLVSGRIVAPLEESFKKQRQFVSDAGHELKTPISVIGANAELLEREQGNNRWLDNIRSENSRMAGLVNDMLQLARTEMVKPVFSRVDLSHAVGGSALPFESVAYEKGVSFSCEVMGDVAVNGSRDRLEHLTSILVDNALEHTERGGAVTVRLSNTRSGALLSVSNTGAEIPVQMRDKIFERFYRADESRTGGSGHYGLGLAIAKAITDAHGGKISIDCTDGVTTFYVSLPRESR